MYSRMKWAYTIAKLFNRRNIYVQDTIVRFFWWNSFHKKNPEPIKKIFFFSLILLFIVDQSVVKTSLRIRIIFPLLKAHIFTWAFLTYDNIRGYNIITLREKKKKKEKKHISGFSLPESFGDKVESWHSPIWTMMRASVLFIGPSNP